MSEDEQLQQLLRRAVPRAGASEPARDLWIAVEARMDARKRWSRFDVGLAVAVVLGLAAFPETLWLLAYHL